ncbi:hypothetical protein EGR_09789 [Echinococcus granulosus]|uniref:Uncharacterized protein n=1 Tax=Echinococcus granulosus TaxID=6210 RepID=W6UA47_ECHGR|nr:hypothetical protein EGR_09789 [Echinococcus granulosus]EUB55352.1 hypothetical protein EGR_09789 [Echinococcus granulosus]
MDNFDKAHFSSFVFFFCACETKYAPIHDWSLRYLKIALLYYHFGLVSCQVLTFTHTSNPFQSLHCGGIDFHLLEFFSLSYLFNKNLYRILGPVEENHLKFQLTLLIKKSPKHLSLLFRSASFEDDHFPYFFAHNLFQHVCWKRSIVMAINDRRPWQPMDFLFGSDREDGASSWDNYHFIALMFAPTKQPEFSMPKPPFIVLILQEENDWESCGPTAIKKKSGNLATL